MNDSTTDETANIVFEDDLLAAGFTTIPNAILRFPGITPGAKLLYVLLLSYAWNSGSCFPGQDRVADDLGVSERSVRNYITELETVGLLRIKQRGLGQTNIYYVPRIPRPAESSAQTGKYFRSDRQNLPTKKTQIKNKHPEDVENEKYRRFADSVEYSDALVKDGE